MPGELWALSDSTNLGCFTIHRMAEVITRQRGMKYSLRTLLLATLVVSIFPAFYAFQASSIRAHRNAVRHLRQMGGQPDLMTHSGGIWPSFSIQQALNDGATLAEIENGTATVADANQKVDWPQESFMDIVFGRPSLALSYVDLSDPDLEEDDIRSMVNHMQKVILLPINETYNGVCIRAVGNGSFTPELVEEIRDQLLGFRFSQATPLPNSAEHPIQTGMTTAQVEQAVASKMYDQRIDWVGDPAPILKMLGSIHETYKNTDGTITWTYATDEIGVGVIVIDFDKTQCVTKISLNHGIPDRLIGKRLPSKIESGLMGNAN